MKKIGITGSLASGKTTASKILSFKKGPLFSADYFVKKLYKKNYFKKIISKSFKIKNNSNQKKKIAKIILNDKSKMKKLEKIVHPLVRKEMRNFIRKNRGKDYIFFEIPLLVESNLMKNFDRIFFIKAKKKTRLKRFLSKGGSRELFETLNSRQLSENKKIKYCDFIVVNDKNKNILKKKLLSIFRPYE